MFGKERQAQLDRMEGHLENIEKHLNALVQLGKLSALGGIEKLAVLTKKPATKEQSKPEDHP